MFSSEKYFKIFLWLIAIHSFIVAMLLIMLDESGIQYFGFQSSNSFFEVQGGVFHLVMCVAYILTSLNLSGSKRLIIFIILAKFIATFYLILYYLVIDPIVLVLISGFVDGIMGLIVYLFLRNAADNYFDR